MRTQRPAPITFDGDSPAEPQFRSLEKFPRRVPRASPNRRPSRIPRKQARPFNLLWLYLAVAIILFIFWAKTVSGARRVARRRGRRDTLGVVVALWLKAPAYSAPASHTLGLVAGWHGSETWLFLRIAPSCVIIMYLYKCYY